MAIWARKIDKRHPDQEEKLKLSLFTDDIILHVEKPYESTHQKTIMANKQYSKFAGYRINIKN